MTKKNRLIYKIITIITLAVPLPLYLFLSATLFSINPDYIIKNIDHEAINVVVVDEELFAYTNNQDAIYNGTTVYLNGEYGFYLDEDTIIKTDDGYFSYKEDTFVNIKRLALQKEMSYKVPLAFIISAFGIGIVFLVVQRKMEWYKKYPRLSVLIALLMTTLILLIINTIVSNILNVFTVATISWAVYYIEYLVKENILTDDEVKKTESDLISNLKKALGE